MVRAIDAPEDQAPHKDHSLTVREPRIGPTVHLPNVLEESLIPVGVGPSNCYGADLTPGLLPLTQNQQAEEEDVPCPCPT